MLAIKINRENYPILNQIYDILAELNNQGKQIMLCKVPAHMGIKRNKEAAKQAEDMAGMATIRPPHTDYYLTIRSGLETLSGKENGKTVLASYTTLNNASKSGKVHRTNVIYEIKQSSEFVLDKLD